MLGLEYRGFECIRFRLARVDLESIYRTEDT